MPTGGSISATGVEPVQQPKVAEPPSNQIPATEETPKGKSGPVDPQRAPSGKGPTSQKSHGIDKGKVQIINLNTGDVYEVDPGPGETGGGTTSGAAGSKDNMILEKLRNWWTGGGWNNNKDAEKRRVVKTVDGFDPSVPVEIRGPERYIDYNKDGDIVGIRDVRGIQDDSGSLLLGPGVFKAGKVLAKAVAAGIKPAIGRQTVWASIKATQEVWPGTVIPRSFELTAGTSKVWIHGNVTEHLAEYATSMAKRGVSMDLVRINTQAKLTSLQAAVKTASAKGIQYNKLVTSGGWNLKFSPPRAPGQLPALIHALPVQ